MGFQSSGSNAVDDCAVPRESLLIAAADKAEVKTEMGTFSISSERGGIEVIDRWAEEWRSLCAEAVEDQPFYRPEWIKAYVRKFGREKKVHLIAARSEKRLCLLLPLLEELSTFSKVPVRRLRAPVNGTCGRFDAVRRAGAEGNAAIQATWDYLKRLNAWDLLQFSNALEESTVSEIAEAAGANGFLMIRETDKPNPLVSIPAEPSVLSQMPPNSKLRSQLRQARRRLAEKGDLRFYRVQTADRDALDRFYQLEASGWKGRIRSCALYDGSRTFYDEVAEQAAHFGYLSLYMLEFNGKLIASHFSFTHRNRCYSPKVAYDEDFKLYAPGHLIVSEILQDCASRGIRDYDITGEDQSWKMKWTNQTRAVSHYFIFRGPVGRLAYTVGSRLRPRVESLFGRKGGLQPDQG